MNMIMIGSRDIGRKIKELRKKRGLTQKDLGEMVGLDQTTISGYENGRRQIDLQKLMKIAQALGVDLKELISVDSKPSEISKVAKIIPLYSLPASAGNGMFPDEIYILDKIPTHRIDVDFAIKVEGDSMSPIVPDGAILLIKKAPEAKDGDMVLCTYDDHVFVKWFHKDNGKIYLVSENPAYSPILVEPHERFEIHGIVLDVIRDSKPKKKFR